MKTKIYSILFLIGFIQCIDSSFAAWYANPAPVALAGAATNCPTDGVINADATNPPSPDPSPMLPWSTGTIYYTQARVRVVGNPITCEFWDATVPTVGMTTASLVWKNANITATLSSGDLGGSGLNTAKYFFNQDNSIPAGWIDANYCLANGTNYLNWSNLTISAEWDHTLYLCARDGAWNTTISAGGAYRLDKTIPTASASTSSLVWKKVNITITLNVNDPVSLAFPSAAPSTVNGAWAIRNYIWHYDNAGPPPSLATCLGVAGTSFIAGNMITLVREWNHTLYVCSQDNAGNQSLYWSGTYRLDKTIPIVSATSASLVWKNADISITLNTSDPVSGAYPSAAPSTITGIGAIRKYVWRYDNGGVAPTLASCLAGGTAFNDNDIITLSREWDHTLYYCAQDVAWNQTALWSGVYRLDKTIPIVSATSASLVWKNADISITLNTSDPVSGAYPSAAPSTITGIGAIRKYVWRYDNGGVAPTLASCLAGGTAFNDNDIITLSREWDHTLYMCAQDVAWKQSALWSGVYRLDKTSPTGTIDYFDGWTNAFNTQIINITTDDVLPAAWVAVSWVLHYTLEVSEASDSPGFVAWGLYAPVAWCINRSPLLLTCPLPALSNHTAYRYRLIVTDIAGTPPTTIVWTDILKIDTTIPVLADVINGNPPNYLASTPLYALSVWNALGSPINFIQVDTENENTLAPVDIYTSATSFLAFIWNMRNVDSDRLPNGGREYTLNLTDICDEAWNCWGGIDPKIHTVYANTKNITQHAVISEGLTAAGNIADGTTKNLTIELIDIHGNKIIPATGIGRTIDLNFDINNTMNLDQFNRLGNSVFLNRTTDAATFLNRFTTGLNSLDGEISSDGRYTYGFQVYTPTFNQDNPPVSDPLAQFTINNINYDINSATLIEAWDTPQAGVIDGVFPIISKFSPLFSTAIVWDLRDGWFIEWAEQISAISIARQASPVVTALDTLDIAFSWANVWSFRFYANTSSPPSTEIVWSWSLYSAIFPWSTFLYSQLVQRPNTVSTLSNLMMSTHLKYRLNGKSIVTNSNLIGKSSFHDAGPAPLAGNQVGIKILGSIWGKNVDAILTDQFSTWVSVFKGTDRSLIRQEIKKNIALATRNAILSPVWSSVSDLSSLPWGATAQGVFIWQPWDKSIMLIEKNGGNVILDITSPLTSKISWIRTLVVRGANLFIKSDMYYDPLNPSMLGIVLEKDINGNGWNLYIDPNITNVVGTYIIDGSVMSYDSVKGILGSTGTIADLKNQLHIYGTIVSENTIGWSRQSPPKCPNLLNVVCANVADSQKYDLNYLRRYYITALGEPFGGAKVIGWGTCPLGACTPGNPNLVHKFSDMTNEFSKYPIIIEFNPKIQSMIPIGFDKIYQD